MDNSSKERRKYFRIYRNFILTYHEKGKSKSNHNVSQVNNVSKGGLSFSSTSSLKQGTLLEIDLKTPFLSDSIHLEGSVLESREKVADMIYEIRVEFQEIPESVSTVLEKIENYGKTNA